jgi:hypothetical protein
VEVAYGLKWRGDDKGEYRPVYKTKSITEVSTTNINKMPFHEITLNDGRKIPQIGFGSWKIPKDVCSGQVDQAIDVGFDHIDTAQGMLISWPALSNAYKADDQSTTTRKKSDKP